MTSSPSASVSPAASASAAFASTPLSYCLVFFGPPGAGKGTQAKRIAQAHGWSVLSIGDVLRTVAREPTPLGDMVRSYVQQGILVPDETMLDIVRDYLQRILPCVFILDGFPRNLHQAGLLDDCLKQCGFPDGLSVIALQLSDEEVQTRLAGRLFCSQCHEGYHRLFKPPVSEGVCDRCGAMLGSRSDDQLEVIEQRLQVYHQQTEPLLELYAQRGILTYVNGALSMDAVGEAIEKLLPS